MMIRAFLAVCLLTSAPMFSNQFPPAIEDDVFLADQINIFDISDEKEDEVVFTGPIDIYDSSEEHAPINVGLNFAAIVAQIDEEESQKSSDLKLSEEQQAEIQALFASKASKSLSVAGSWDDSIDLPVNAYPGIYHYWIQCSPDRSWFRIEDGSVWTIRYADRSKISGWNSGYPLVLRLNNFSDSDKYYQYQLYNTVTDEAIQVNLYEGPLLGGANTVSIYSFFSNGYQFNLTNGSIWDVRLSDCDNMNGWNAGDCVYVVPNEDLWTKYFYSYRVVNIAKNRNVRANWKS